MERLGIHSWKVFQHMLNKIRHILEQNNVNSLATLQMEKNYCYVTVIVNSSTDEKISVVVQFCRNSS